MALFNEKNNCNYDIIENIEEDYRNDNSSSNSPLLMMEIKFIKESSGSTTTTFSSSFFLMNINKLFTKLSNFFLADNLIDIGAKESPVATVVTTTLAHEKQTIGLLHLRLAPPEKVRNARDLLYLVLNHEFVRLIMLVLWLILCGYIETFLAQWSDMRYYQQPAESKHPLPDLFHDALPRVSDTQIVNYLLTTTILYTVIGFAIQSPDWTTRFLILRRFAFIMGFIYVFRGITLLITTLPSSLVDECRPPEVELTGSMKQRFGFIMEVIGGTALTCTDNIFSGHTSMMMSCCIIWRVHSRLRRPFGWILYAIASAGILMILFTRFHYSVDVILAIYICYSAWNIYLQYIQEASMRYMFGFTRHSTFDVFTSSNINSCYPEQDAAAMYEYLTWQPHPLGKKWLMWLAMYVDGLDIRLRALRIFDEQGVWQQHHNGDKKQQVSSMVEKSIFQSVV